MPQHPDKDLQFVCDYTGLNEQAIDILRFITTGRGYDLKALI